MENLTKIAKQVLRNSDVLLDIMIETENTRMMVVRSVDKVYILRFMNEKCYTLVTLEDCVKAPVKTHYSNDSCRYVLNGIKGNERSILYSSNDLLYLIDNRKWQSSFYDKLVIIDTTTGNVISEIVKDMPNVYYLPEDSVLALVKLLTELSKDLGIENRRRILRLTYENYTAALISGDNSKDISNSKYIYELGRVFSRLEYTFDFDIECVVFNPYMVCNRKVKCYCKESIKKLGSIRVVLE